MHDLNVDPDRLISLFTDISATTNALKARAPMVAALMKGADPGGVTFTVDSGAKDLRTMAAEGRKRGHRICRWPSVPPRASRRRASAAGASAMARRSRSTGRPRKR